MASAQLPTPILTAEERDQIVAVFGTADDFKAALASWLSDEVERRAAAAAREQANTTVREAVEQAVDVLPETVRPKPVKIEPVEIEPIKPVEPAEELIVDDKG